MAQLALGREFVSVGAPDAAPLQSIGAMIHASSGWINHIALVTVASVLVTLGVVPGFGTVQMIANLPIMPQEIVFAVWLIVKGVHPSIVLDQEGVTR